MALNSPGIGSGLDVKTLVSQLVNASAQAPTVRFNKQEAELQAQISGLGALKGALSSFQSSLSAVNNAGNYTKKTASNTETDLFRVSANSEATAGSYSVIVSTLATNQKLASKVFADSSSSVGTGTLNFRFGTYDSGANTFTANADKATQAITIDSSSDSLEGIRDAVNQAKIGVTATIVNDGTGSRLVFTSDDTGAANSLEVTVSNDSVGSNVDDSGLSRLAYDPTVTGEGKNLEEKVTATNATLSIDGIDITSETNKVEGAIQGVTLNLIKADDTTTATVTVSENRSSITKSVNGFISAYNKLVDTTNHLSGYNKETGVAGVLLGDATLRGVNNQVQRILSNTVLGVDSAYNSLVSLGIKTQEGGHLKLDEARLNKALNDDFASVAKVFAAVGSASDSLVKVNGFSDSTVVGKYAVNISQLASHGSYAGVATSGFPLDIVTGENDTFTIKVDDVTSGTIALSAGTYNNSADLVVELQDKLNADATLKEASRSVTVSFDTDHFVFSSDRYGSDSSITIESTGTTTEATFGFSTGAGTSTNGLNVEGTIGGVTATGSGQTLTGTGSASGLSLEITGDDTGDRGTIDFTRGVADRLSDLLGSLLDSDGIFNSRTDSLKSRVEDINEQREALAQRLEALEERYLRQFNAMDALVAQLQSTSNFLSSQLSNTPFANFNN
jgi:flagellar hook-associated protein 2